MRWAPIPLLNSNKVGTSVSVQSHRNECFALTLLAFPSMHVQASPALLEVPGGDCPETSFASNRLDTSTGFWMSVHLPFTSVKARYMLPLPPAGNRKEMGHHPEEGKKTAQLYCLYSDGTSYWLTTKP